MPKQKRRKRHVKRQWGKIDVEELAEAGIKKTEVELEGGAIASRPNNALFLIDKVKSMSLSSTYEFYWASWSWAKRFRPNLSILTLFYFLPVELDPELPFLLIFNIRYYFHSFYLLNG